MSVTLALAAMILSSAVALPLSGAPDDAIVVAIDHSDPQAAPAPEIARVSTSSGKVLSSVPFSRSDSSPMLFHEGVQKFIGITTDYTSHPTPVTTLWKTDANTGKTDTGVHIPTFGDTFEPLCVAEYGSDGLILMIAPKTSTESNTSPSIFFRYYVVNVNSGQSTLKSTVAKQGKLDFNNWDSGCFSHNDKIVLIARDPLSQDYSGAFTVDISKANATVSFVPRPADFGVSAVFGIEPSSGKSLSFRHDTFDIKVVAWDSSSTSFDVDVVAKLDPECSPATFTEGGPNNFLFSQAGSTLYLSCVQNNGGLGDVGDLTVAKVDLQSGKSTIQLWQPLLESKQKSVSAIGH